MSTPSKEDVEAAPEALLDGSYCTSIEDFFSTGSRDLIGRFFTSFIESVVITPTELVFSAKSQKRLNDAGRVMMNAVDKIATLQAKAKSESASQRLRDLNTLISAGMKKIWDDDKEKPIAAITPVGAAFGNKLFPSETQTTIAAVAGFDKELCFIYKRHRRRQ